MLKPFQLLLVLYFSLMFLGGLLTRTYERSIPSVLTIYDGFWLAVETQATIGYGEMPPDYYIPQLVCCAVACVGVFTNALVTTSLLRITKLNVKELEFATLVRRHVDQRKVDMAVVLLQRWWKLIAARKHNESLRFIRLLSFYDQAGRFHKFTRMRVTERSRELPELLRLAQYTIDQRMQAASRSLRQLNPLRDNLARFNTQQVGFLSKMLLVKRKIVDLCSHLREGRQRRMRYHSRRSSAFSKKQQKLASEGAYRRMLEHRAGHRSVSEFSALRLI